MTLDSPTWLERYADALGVDAPSTTDEALILELASVAAHASERRSAPLSCWMAAVAGRSPHEALEIARAVEDAGPTANSVA